LLAGLARSRSVSETNRRATRGLRRGGPGVTALFSVPSSSSAADLMRRRASSLFPWGFPSARRSRLRLRVPEFRLGVPSSLRRFGKGGLGSGRRAEADSLAWVIWPIALRPTTGEPGDGIGVGERGFADWELRGLLPVFAFQSVACGDCGEGEVSDGGATCAVDY